MANFQGHITTSAILGVAVGAVGSWYLHYDWGTCCLAAGLTTKKRFDGNVRGVMRHSSAEAIAIAKARGVTKNAVSPFSLNFHESPSSVDSTDGIKKEIRNRDQPSR